MRDVNMPDSSKGLPDERFPLHNDQEFQEEYDSAAMAVSVALGSDPRLSAPTGDPPAWMLWGVEE